MRRKLERIGPIPGDSDSRQSNFRSRQQITRPRWVNTLASQLQHGIPGHPVLGELLADVAHQAVVVQRGWLIFTSRVVGMLAFMRSPVGDGAADHMVVDLHSRPCSSAICRNSAA